MELVRLLILWLLAPGAFYCALAYIAKRNVSPSILDVLVPSDAQFDAELIELLEQESGR